MLFTVCLDGWQQKCSKQRLELERHSAAIIQLLQAVDARSLWGESALTLGFPATVCQLQSWKATGETCKKSLIVIKSDMSFLKESGLGIFLILKA